MLIKAIESGFGVGISETIVNGYQKIAQLYRPGDEIFILGFSRGAFAARCIAGVISRCGLLHAEYERFAPDVVQIYRTRPQANNDEPLNLDMVYPGIGSKLELRSRNAVGIKFLGVFDTVASLGFPLWGWWFRASPVWRNFAFSTDPAKVCKHIYHALAMDERRSQFFPTLFTMPQCKQDQPAVLQQVWFRGAHADIGGGYTRHDLSDAPLEWMMCAMMGHGLTFKAGSWKTIAPNSVATLHDELVREPTWNFFGSWPRWHPVDEGDPSGQGSRLHPSVVKRAKQIERETGRPDLQIVTEKVEFVVNASVPWFRTGLIIETGKYYKLTYLEGLTRDAECPPCGPAGQKAGWFDIRRLPIFWPRLPNENWMLLAATIAHPRIWTPQEKGLGKGIFYLFVRAPKLLQDQIAVIGKDLKEVNDCVYITSKAPSGLLYLFVNDLWATTSNNSGGPRLSLELIDKPSADGVLFTLEHHIEIVGKKQNETDEWVRSLVHADAG